MFLDGAHTDSRVWGEFLMRKPVCLTQKLDLTAREGEFGDCLAMHPQRFRDSGFPFAQLLSYNTHFGKILHVSFDLLSFSPQAKQY